jgi:hypothetical protein
MKYVRSRGRGVGGGLVLLVLRDLHGDRLAQQRRPGQEQRLLHCLDLLELDVPEALVAARLPVRDQPHLGSRIRQTSQCFHSTCCARIDGRGEK